MSNIYIQEPPTNGKVVLKTTIGEIEIELWSKECPKTCRNFVQLCMEGYYDGTIFHRVVKDFIAQGGDPTGTGQGGESIYGEPFKDEFHSRLRFNRRGLVGMANADKDDNGSQFFFTLGNTPELTKKHTLFGKVAGNTIYNMIRLNECECVDERPIRPEKIKSTEIIYNPFSDIVPRNLKATPVVVKEDKNKSKGVKNYGLLSFGEEAEDDEEVIESVTKELKPKAKSAHDVGDPTLLSKPVIEENTKSESSSSNDESASEDDRATTTKKETIKVDIGSIKSKLMSKKQEQENKVVKQTSRSKYDEIDEKRKQTQLEIKRLEKELNEKKKKDIEKEEEKKVHKEEVEVVKKYKEDKEKYESLKKKKNKNNKEEKTLELLQAFRERLFKAKKTETNEDEEKEAESFKNENKSSDIEETNNENKASIWTHKLEIEEEIKQKVIDANIADHERYDIYDPRNPLNKRKREESRDLMQEKKRSSFTGGYGSSKYEKR